MFLFSAQADRLPPPLPSSSGQVDDSGDVDPWQAVAQLSVHLPSIGIISFIQNKGCFLDEWIAFHWLQGVRKFVLFDDGSEDGTRDVLEKYIRRDIVDYRPVNTSAPNLIENEGHMGTRTDYLDDYLKEISMARDTYGLDWVIFSDADEFVYANGPNMTLAQVLEAHYQGEACVNIFRKDFGTSGHILRPKSGLVIENYVLSSNQHRIAAARKLVINLKPLDENLKVTHVPDPYQLANPLQLQCTDNTTNEMQMNRYLHSLEDYNVKLKSFYLPNDPEYTVDPLKRFWEQNRNDVFDDSAPRRYTCEVRALLLYMLKDGQESHIHLQGEDTSTGVELPNALETAVTVSSQAGPKTSSLDGAEKTTDAAAPSCDLFSTKDPWIVVAERSSQEPTIAICAVIRNEGRDLDEWLAFNWLQGVRKFIIYDDGSTDDTVRNLDKFVRRNIVELRTMNRSIEIIPPKKGVEGIKVAHINFCLEEMWALRDVEGLDWVYLPDADEIGYPMESSGMTLASALDTHYSGVPCVRIYRKDFGSSGHFHRPKSGLVIENYVYSAKGPRRDPEKVIINLRPKNENSQVKRVFGAHKAFQKLKDNICKDDKLEFLQMNHYLRSLEEYELKLQTFFSPEENNYNDPLGHFWERDRHEIIDDIAQQRYACEVRALLSNMQEGRTDLAPSSFQAPSLPKVKPRNLSKTALPLTVDELLSQLLGTPDPPMHPLIMEKADSYDCQVRCKVAQQDLRIQIGKK